MISFVQSSLLELRKRTDTQGSITAYALLSALVIACGVLSVWVVKSAPSFGAGEVLVIVGLPAALASAIVGVVFGVGDGRVGGERDGILTCLSRDTLYLARGCACVAMVAGLVIASTAVALLSVVVASALGGELSSVSFVTQLGEVASLALAAAALGFGIGASLRGLAVALASVLLIILVVDTTLALAGPWTDFIRFSTVQAGVTGDAPFLPSLTSGLLWIGVPLVGGWLRTRSAEV
ncbi:hypothetical protein DEJ21_11185 [Curtobacterium sp. MCSS17_006]|uniref:hypothetical protein n=1 Tax=Curtobacterium TaxID=2034 RepID=UPI000DAA78B1|nr:MULTISPECIES: hypothetical protein [Curtobacterium]MBT1675389.1 hypothetical protein [Curtobacterium flaccumfaciens pv. flaccumfaciens]PZE35202.1 hypothetical protein DEJ21_11185 [Curtobacterium sp. MCSS17_006]